MQKAASSSWGPFGEKTTLENPQIFQSCKYKINFPLIIAKANASAILNQKLFFFSHKCYNKNEFLIVGEADGNNA